MGGGGHQDDHYSLGEILENFQVQRGKIVGRIIQYVVKLYILEGINAKQSMRSPESQPEIASLPTSLESSSSWGSFQPKMCRLAKTRESGGGFGRATNCLNL